MLRHHWVHGCNGGDRNVLGTDLRALVPLTLLWAFEYGLQVDWDVFWTAAGNVWLIGHGVDVSFSLGAAAAKATGLSGASAPIGVSVAALGFAGLFHYVTSIQLVKVYAALVDSSSRGTPHLLRGSS